MFKDYNAYREFRPQYAPWKEAREKQEAKRLAYLEKHPEIINKEDIERGKAILNAIDVLDEYSQAKAENMEIMTETLSQNILSGISLIGEAGGLAAIYKIKPLKEKFDKLAKTNKTLSIITIFVPMAIGGTIASLAAFPIMAWAAKAETGASRKGRLEAMQTKLQNPAFFASLNETQKEQLKQKASKIKLSKEEQRLQTPKFSLKDSFKVIKNINKEEEIERKEQIAFQKLIEDFDKNTTSDLKGEALLNARKEQQILTRLVEKIDLASQDYAENVEFAMNALTVISPLLSMATGWLGSKLNEKLNIGKSSKIAIVAPWIIGLTGGLSLATLSAKVQKQASRVGRFKVKQELAQHPEQLIYVDDEKINAEISDEIKIITKKRPNMLNFLIQIFKDNKEYKKYQKTQGLKDKKKYKALEKLEVNEEQLKAAKILQRNTFKTFNKVDEMSQKYSENVEAVGNSIKEPLKLACRLVGMIIGFRYLMKIPDAIKNSANKTVNLGEIIKGWAKYMTSCTAAYLPVLAFDYHLTKQQKEASRVANMLAINDLKDISNYKGYSSKEEVNTTKIDEKKFLR